MHIHQILPAAAPAHQNQTERKRQRAAGIRRREDRVRHSLRQMRGLEFLQIDGHELHQANLVAGQIRNQGRQAFLCVNIIKALLFRRRSHDAEKRRRTQILPRRHPHMAIRELNLAHKSGHAFNLDRPSGPRELQRRVLQQPCALPRRQEHGGLRCRH